MDVVTIHAHQVLILNVRTLRVFFVSLRLARHAYNQ